MVSEMSRLSPATRIEAPEVSKGMPMPDVAEVATMLMLFAVVMSALAI